MTAILRILLIATLFAPCVRAQSTFDCASNDCLPVADFSSQTEVCVLERIDFIEEACKEDLSFYAWDFGDGTSGMGAAPSHRYALPGVYTVTLSVKPRESCTVATVKVTREITVVEPPNPTFTISDDDRVACVSQEVTFTSLTAASTGVRWAISSPENWALIGRNTTLDRETISVRFDSVGNYRVRLTAANACSSETVDTLIRVRAAPTFDLQPVAGGCGTTRVSPARLKFRVGGDHLGVRWIFTQGNRKDTIEMEDFGHYDFRQSGTVSVAVKSACDVSERLVRIGVQQPKELVLTVPAEYCEGSGPENFGASISGGSWSGPGITDRSLGTFDPSLAGVGTAPITYAVTDGRCSYSETREVKVVASDKVTTTAESLCVNSGVTKLLATPLGGSWSGSGIVDSQSGGFDPLLSGAGTFFPVYTYTGSGGCEITRPAEVTVLPLPRINLPDTLTICLSDTIFSLYPLLGNLAGGDLTLRLGDRELARGILNPVNDLGVAGNYPLRYEYSKGGCAIEGTVILRAEEPVALSIAGPGSVCQSSRTHSLKSTQPGGVWSGPAIDPATGTIDLIAAGGGTFTYTYTYQGGTPCQQQQTIEVTVEPTPPSLTAGPDLIVCASPDSLLELTGALPTGGKFSGPGLTGTGVDLNKLIPDSTHTYSYSVTSANGCVAVANRTLRYSNLPEVTIVGPDTLCAATPFLLASSDPAAGTFKWDMGDGRVLTGPAPSATYAVSGSIYLQKLTTTTAPGCTATTSREIYVEDVPDPSFVLDSLSGCAPFVVALSPTVTSASYLTYFSLDGDTLRGGQPHLYTLRDYGLDTMVEVKLSVANACGARARVQKVSVKHKPTASFGFRTDEGCSPFQPVLANNSSGEITSHAWDFGEGSASTDRSPAVPFFSNRTDSLASFRVTLVTGNACGLDTAVQRVSVKPPDVTAFISLPDTVSCQPYILKPLSLSTAGSTLLWTVTDSIGKKVATSILPQPQFMLTRPGRYRIVLSSTGCGAATDTAYVTVLAAPGVNIGFPGTVCENAEVEFRVDTTDLSSIDWNFGAAGRSTSLNPKIVFSTSGTLRFTVTGTSLLNGCRTTVRDEIEVLPAPVPSPRISEQTGCVPLTTTFSSGLPDSLGYSVEWSFGSGNDRSDLFLPAYTYSDTGSFTGRLRVTDRLGCTTTASLPPISVEATASAAIASDTTTYCGAPVRVAFGNESTGANTYKWNFGDGVNSTLTSPTHNYLTAGDHRVDLIAVTGFGCRDTATTTITVLENPQAGFVLPPPVSCTPFAVHLEADITDANRYTWYLNGEETFTGRTFDTLLAGAGIYDLRLVVSNRKACRDSLEVVDAFVLEPTPGADFSPRVDTDPLAVGDVSFLNLSSGGDYYRWAFGDGTFSNEQSPVHLYGEEGAYSVTLTTSADFAGGITCSEAVTRVVRPEFFGRFFLPTAISPESGPPEVRLWGAKGVGVAACDIQVFSPYGQRVYATSEVADGQPVGRWDGTYPDDASPVPGGAYTWRARVTYDSGRTDNLLGTVTVIR